MILVDSGPQTRQPGRVISEADRLHTSTNFLRTRAPGLSAFGGLSLGQRMTGIVAPSVAVATFVVFGISAFQVVATLLSLLYLAIVGERVALFMRVINKRGLIVISDEDALDLSDDDAPMYSVLIPAYKEPEVVEGLFASIGAMNYPRHRLEVFLCLEQDDVATLERAHEVGVPDYVRIIVVPPGNPQTKPRACNYALSFATGTLVTIYDAEDHPDPLQLRKAAVALARAPKRLACVQARLRYHNVSQNLLTRWFTLEYDVWFTYFLPALVSRRSVIPLGGTSNHFRRDVLEMVGGWDPYNVTEDADLGVRLHRFGFEVGVLDSTTDEEANSDFINWLKQRSRWYKGYLVTFFVHLRRPKDLYRHLGPKGFLEFALFVGGTPIMGLINPISWVTTLIWFLFEPAPLDRIFSGPSYYINLVCWLVGNFCMVYVVALAALKRPEPKLLRAALLTPVYWVMMSLASAKAAWQFVTAPSHWEKTVHGLGSPRPGAAAPPGSVLKPVAVIPDLVDAVSPTVDGEAS